MICQQPNSIFHISSDCTSGKTRNQQNPAINLNHFLLGAQLSISSASHLRHGFLVWFLLRVGPVHDHVTVPDLDPAAAEAPLGLRGGLVGLVLQEAEAAVLLLVVRGAVDDDIHQILCGNSRVTPPHIANCNSTSFSILPSDGHCPITVGLMPLKTNIEQR